MRCLITGEVSPLTIARLRATFETAGLHFVDEDWDFGPGIRLRKAAVADDCSHSSGPATDVIARMETEIEADRRKRKP